MIKDELIIWGWLAVFASVIDLVSLYFIFRGKYGDGIRAEHTESSRRYGGIRVYVAIIIALNIFLAPIGFIGSLIGEVRLRRRWDAERHQMSGTKSWRRLPLRHLKNFAWHILSLIALFGMLCLLGVLQH